MKFPNPHYFLIVLSVLFISCSNDSTITSNDETATEGETPTEEDDPIDEEPTDDTDSLQPNILLIIADDMGLDATPRYDVGTIKPEMPNLEKMMDLPKIPNFNRTQATSIALGLDRIRERFSSFNKKEMRQVLEVLEILRK